jgi:hypothetical protein
VGVILELLNAQCGREAKVCCAVCLQDRFFYFVERS